MSVKNLIKVANYFGKKYNITKQAFGDDFEIQEGVSSSTGIDFTDPSFNEALDEFIKAVRALQNYLISNSVYVEESLDVDLESKRKGNNLISRIRVQRINFDADFIRSSCYNMVESLSTLQRFLSFYTPNLTISGITAQPSNLSNLPSLIRKALEAYENLQNEFSKHQVESTAISLREDIRGNRKKPTRMDREINRKQREFEASIFGRDVGERVDPDNIHGYWD